MTDLEELLSGYFKYERNLNKEYQEGLSNFYNKSNAVFKFQSLKYQLKGAISHYHEDSKSSEAVLHIPDMILIRTSEEKCLYPLSFILSCNYMYYGCYMSIACYLLNINPKYITLYHPVDNHEKYVLKYRPEIAKVFLSNRLKSLEAIKRSIQKRVVKEKECLTPDLYS